MKHLPPTLLLLPALACGGPDEAQKADMRPAPQEISGEPILVTGFASPEAVRYDQEGDVYLVANINGDPSEHDDNGFISRVSPGGEILELRWIDGAEGDFTLDAPKGMALRGHMLLVADIDHVRIFDRGSGAHIADWPVEGARFLNDVAVAEDGTVYVTDTGARVLYRFEGSTPVVVASGDALGSPNGVDTDADGVVVVLWDGGAKRIDPVSGTIRTLPAPDGARLDGVVLMEDGSYLVSSWDQEAVLRVAPDGAVTEILGSVPRAADIGYDPKRNRVLVPTFDHELHVVRLEG